MKEYLEISEKLTKIMEDKKLSKISLKVGDFEFKASAEQNIHPTSYYQSSQNFVSEETEKSSLNIETNQQKLSGNIIKSPIVGTFYKSPGEGKPPFVSIGDKVCVGQTLFIIESMKIMNEIQSEFDGVVDKILVNNGDSIEFGQPIIVIK